ncbi:MAG: hypothetical protein R6V67_03100 [Spirochaetia bacterium]
MGAGKSNTNLSDHDIQDLETRREDILKEIEEYNREREKIKSALGNIGGERYKKTDKIMNIVFLILIVLLVVAEFTLEFFPTFVWVELGVLLVSIKIMWMIYSQHKFNHFQFWVLNSIEFRINQTDKRIRNIEHKVEALAGTGDKEAGGRNPRDEGSEA